MTEHWKDLRENELHVQMYEGKSHVELNFIHDGKLHQMERGISEPVEKSLTRIARHFQYKDKKSKKKGRVLHDLGYVSLIQPDGSPVEDLSKLTNGYFETGMIVFISSENLSLSVIKNAPVITSIGIFPKKYAHANSFLVPQTTHLFSTSVHYAWYSKSDDDIDYRFVSEDHLLCPPYGLEGCSLKLSCTPYRLETNSKDHSSEFCIWGRSAVQYFNKRLLPDTMTSKSIECRHDFLLNSVDSALPSCIRLVCYNILSGVYTRNSRALISYDYLEDPEMTLSDEFRLQLIVRELLAYRGNIICLQEVDETAFNKYLQPILSQHGYLSHHTTKDGDTVEGCATFVSSNTFQVLHTIDISLRDIFAHKISCSNYHLHKLINRNSEIEEILTRRITTIAQISILRHRNNPDKICLAVNTHLFYHPKANYIRALQIHEIIRQMELVKLTILSCNDQENPESAFDSFLHSLKCQRARAFFEENASADLKTVDSKFCALPQKDVSVSTDIACVNTDTQRNSKSTLEVSCLLFGDLNSSPRGGVVNYVTSGKVEPTNSCWDTVDIFTWQNGTASGDNLCLDYTNFRPSLNHSLHFKSASGFPKYTNYTKDFKELLDYIFIENGKYEVAGVAPVPSEEILSENTAIPSAVFPSDHVALVVDVHMCGSS